MVDLITNSSSEIFMYDVSTTNETLKKLISVLSNNCSDESSVQEFNDSSYKDEIILPNGVDAKNVYVVRVDYNDRTLGAVLSEFFTEIPMKWKSEEECE